MPALYRFQPGASLPLLVVALLLATAPGPREDRHPAAFAPPAFVLAQTTPAKPRTAEQDTVRAGAASDTAGVPVVLAGDTLFRLYGALGPFDARQRARAVSDRLANLARAGAESVTVAAHETSSDLVVGDAVVMTVLDADAAPQRVTRAALAARYADRITRALATTGRSLTLRALAADAGYALFATAVLIVLMAGIGNLFPRIYRRIEGVRHAAIPALRIQGVELVSAARVAHALLLLARALRIVATLILLYFYVPLVLSFFPWTAPLSRQIVGYALAPLAAAWQSILAFLPNLFTIAVIVILMRVLLSVLHAFFRAVEAGAIAFSSFHPEWAEPTYKIVRVAVLVFAVVLVFPYLPGAQSEAFKGVSLVVGVLLSFGSSAAIGNVVAGVVLTYTRSFQVGDRVQIGDTVGDVTERTLLVTRVRTIKNVAITIPNGTVLSGHVHNFSALAASRGLILHTTVSIGYDAPWPKVHELLIAAATGTEHVQAEPAPFVLQTSLDDFYVSYQLNAYTDRADLMANTLSALHARIHSAFDAAGVEILSPHYRALRDGNASTAHPEKS
jgi:small-conductance mechanosensitive channel